MQGDRQASSVLGLVYEAAIDPRRRPELDRLLRTAEEDGALAALLRPHLARAVEISRRLGEAGRARDGLARALDALRHSVILVDGGMRVLHANRSAAALLAGPDGPEVRGGRLSCVRPAESARLEALVAGAASTTAGGSARGGGVMAVRSRGSATALAVTVLPVSGAQGAALAGAQAIVLIADPAASAPPPLAALTSVFGLSRSEAAVALAVARGGSPKEVAAARGLSFHTVKTLLARVFQKVRARSQAELVHVLHSWFPQLRSA